MKPKCTVITPTYNCEDVIAETIESVQKQSMKDWQYILIDDCSQDNTREIISKYAKQDERIECHSLDINSGRPAVPRNKAMEIAKGEYVAFLDADDLWHQQKLEVQIQTGEEFNCPFISSALIDFYDSSDIYTGVKDIFNKDSIQLDKIDHGKLLHKNCLPNSSVVVKKDLLDEFRFNEDMRYKAIEDYHLWLRVHQRIPYSLKVQRPLLFYRRSETGISKSKLAMFKKNYMLYSEYLIGSKRLGIKKYYYLLSYVYFSILRQFRKRL